MLTIDTLPDAAPADVGANVAVKDALLLALMFSGNVAPLTLNPAPEAVSWLTVSVALPALVRVIVCGALLPTETLP